jgi:hypothetical protein
MIAAAESTKDSKANNRVRWGLQDRIAKQELLFGDVNQKVKSTKYIRDIHESEFQTHGGVSTIRELPWAILDKVDVTALLGQELGEKAIAASIEYLNPPDKDIKPTNFSWIRTTIDKISEWTEKSYD